jgi:hypothetical protein
MRYVILLGRSNTPLSDKVRSGLHASLYFNPGETRSAPKYLWPTMLHIAGA